MKQDSTDVEILELNNNIWSEWTAPEGMKPSEYEAIEIMAKAFSIRVVNDKGTVDAMIDSGVDPDEAWDRVTNWKNWVMVCLLAAFNIGRGEKGAGTAEVFSTYINSMTINDS